MPLVVIDWMDLTQRPGEHGARAKSSRERRAPDVSRGPRAVGGV
jgi:hypothetical protein